MTDLLGGETRGTNQQVDGQISRALSVGAVSMRIPQRPNDWYTGTSVVTDHPEYAVLQSHENNLQPFFLIEWLQGTGPIAFVNWFDVGQAYADKYAPNSAWLQSQGIQDWGITAYTLFNEPDLEVPGHNRVSYHNALRDFAAGVHSIDNSLTVLPGGFAGPFATDNVFDNAEDNWQLEGYGPTAAPLWNDGTLGGLMLHEYNQPQTLPRLTPQHVFDRVKEANEITVDLDYYTDEINNVGDNGSGKPFLTTLWGHLGIVGDAGNGPTGKTRFVHPFSLNQDESIQGWGLSVQREPAWIPSARAETWQLVDRVADGMDYRWLNPYGRGFFVLSGEQQKMWVWMNHAATSTLAGDTVTITGLPRDATSLKVYNYDDYDHATDTLTPEMVIPLDGRDRIDLVGLPTEQTLMFVADGADDRGNVGGLWGDIRLDFVTNTKDKVQINSPLADGYVPFGRFEYDANEGLGWSSSDLTNFDRGPEYSDLERDFINDNEDREFFVDLPRGRYEVVLHLGDHDAIRDNMRVSAEGQVVLNDVNAVRTVVAESFAVDVTDGQLTILFQDIDQPGDANSRWSIAGLEVSLVSLLPELQGDYNADGIVNAADYTVWRNAFGDVVSPPGDGADGDLNGEIDAGDYGVWVTAFGSLAAETTAVPETHALINTSTAFLLVTAHRRRRPRLSAVPRGRCSRGDFL